MKLIAPLGALSACVLAPLALLFISGDPPPATCGGAVAADDAILAALRQIESNHDYTAEATGSTASGAYQFIDGTWAGYGGYARAVHAPPEVQDAKAAEHVAEILDAHDGDIAAIPVVWFIGYLPAPGDPAWDQVPSPANRLTPRQYQQRWFDAYDELTTGDDDAEPSAATDCGAPGAVLEDGFALPAPADLFATAPVDSPHHDYPAWDWGIPTGTPLYAIRGGTVVSVNNWPHNWFDYGCDQGATGCSSCGIGVTIDDDTGTRWTYCHGETLTVALDDQLSAGTQIMTSGNTGRSTGPHLHLQIRTPDGSLRCPQSLLRSLLDEGRGIDPAALPSSGCSY